MSHSFCNLLYHIVFSTKDRQPWLEADMPARLYSYLGGIVREHGGIPIVINGMPDHVHLLVKLGQDEALSYVVRALKSISSRWIREQLPSLASFEWQTGYGAFTVSESQAPRVEQYILNQEQHHRERPFQHEFMALLRANGIRVDESDFWD